MLFEVEHYIRYDFEQHKVDILDMLHKVLDNLDDPTKKHHYL